jgi:DNA-binding NtrC family response regulator
MKPRILLVDDEDSVRIPFAAALEEEGYRVEEAYSAESAMDRLEREPFPIVVSDIYMGEKTGLDLLHRAKALHPSGAVILMTGKGKLETVLEATRGGAFDYLAKPFSVDRLLEAVRGAEAAVRERLSPAEPPLEPASAMVGASPPMVELYKFISRVAPTDATVLLRGETGCGKELVAHLIHAHSERARGRLVVVDCAALPGSLLESELFGVMRGAYTGADRDRIGLFEAAHGGTVLLDEIGEIDPAFQLRLLRFLQEKEIRPVGATASKKVDVRVIAATNKDLAQQRAEGKFRDDLWYRLSVAYFELPPLRQRRQDIPLLVEHFLTQAAGHYGRRMRVEPGAMKLLTDYSWPGNVRQLQHLLERLVILHGAPVLDTAAIRAILPAESSVPPAALAAAAAAADSLSATEEQQIRKVLAATAGNKTKAAEILGIERKTLYRKLERMGE